ncbi:hypothetical protein D7Z54_21970 [Salibacterium salarium]|uniref:Uncharacterized protein n=1 Tax=Salibacterium salarium TaxID=284579 RepID=A0A428MYE4_9BACI|nr:hypothetical protein D7Z54_21970 [Salibacterium salarium]
MLGQSKIACGNSAGSLSAGMTSLKEDRLSAARRLSSKEAVPAKKRSILTERDKSEWIQGIVRII